MSELIDIPMNEWSRERLAAGDKVATSRTELYGKPGDRFIVDSVIYVITHVLKLPLHVISTHFYEEEGAESPAEFRQVWEDIHYRKGYVEDWEVYFHLFRPLNFTDVADEFATLVDELAEPDLLAGILSPGHEATIRRED